MDGGDRHLPSFFQPIGSQSFTFAQFPVRTKQFVLNDPDQEILHYLNSCHESLDAVEFFTFLEDLSLTNGSFGDREQANDPERFRYKVSGEREMRRYLGEMKGERRKIVFHWAYE